MPTVTLIEGDGIGPTVISCACRVVEYLCKDIEWERMDLGICALERHGTLTPQATLDSIERNKLALKGPLLTPIGEGFESVNVFLRKHFNLYAGVRPLTSYSYPNAKYMDVDIVVIRENTEGLYSGIESGDEEGATALRKITKNASLRIIRFAFEYARQFGRKKITLVHKANILKKTCGLFLAIGKEVSMNYTDVEFEDMLIDTACFELVRQPEKFDVIVTTNLFGDILSDLCAGLVGSLGLAAGANIGEAVAIFEPVHGIGKKIKDKSIANPIAAILSAAMLLKHINKEELSLNLKRAVRDVLESGILPYDLGGSADAETITNAIINRL